MQLTNDDLHNILGGIGEAIVIIGMDLRIRRYTHMAEKLLNLVQGDTGRSVSLLNAFVTGQRVEDLAAQVIQHLAPVEMKVLCSDRRWYQLRVTPYKTLDHSIKGAWRPSPSSALPAGRVLVRSRRRTARAARATTRKARRTGTDHERCERGRAMASEDVQQVPERMDGQERQDRMEEPQWSPEPQLEADPPDTRSELSALQRAFHELQVRQTEIEHENEQLRQTNAGLGESVARLADLYDFAPVVYLTVAPDCRIVDANLTAASFFGRVRGALIGTFLTALVVPEERKALRAHVEECLNGHVRVDSQLSFALRGRPRVTAQVTSMPMLDGAGRPAGCKTVLTDVTALAWARETLRFTSRASGILGSSFDVVASLVQIARLAVTGIADVCILDLADKGGGLQRVEAAFADGIVLPHGTLLRTASPAAREGDALRTRKPLWFATVPAPGTQPGSAVRHEPLVMASAPTSIMYVPIVGRGDTLGVLTFISCGSGRHYSSADVATMNELAMHAAMAIENARLYADAQRAIAARQDVLSLVSHDLKNPLMGIMLTTETILRGAPGDDRRRSAAQLRRIQHATQQMRRMIDDLLDMTALEAGRLAVQVEAHDVARLLATAGELFAPLAAASGIDFTITRPASALTVLCDRQRFVQVLTNLVDNAVKFTPAGGRISISVQVADGAAVFAVADTGPGIPVDLRSTIFERFVQGSANVGNGRGLGLYIAKGLIAAQRGAIWVDSQAGAGATFSFALPLASPRP